MIHIARIETSKVVCAMTNPALGNFGDLFGPGGCPQQAYIGREAAGYFYKLTPKIARQKCIFKEF